MRIIQISDLHFGTVFPKVEKAITEKIKELDPQILIVSGDITQRATEEQFKQAKEFIDNLEIAHTMVVPGNHDVSLFKIWERVGYPFCRFKKYFDHFQSSVQIKKVAVTVLNSANPWRHIQGDFNYNKNQLAQLNSHKTANFRIAAFHHPMDCRKPIDVKNLLIDREKRAVDFSDAKIDLVLNGHIHDPHVTTSNHRYPNLKNNMVLAVAGTATSWRTRAVPNSFNLIEVEDSGDQFQISRFDLSNENYFNLNVKTEFKRNTNLQWERTL